MARGPLPSSVPVKTWIVAFDIADDRRRARIVKVLKGACERIQFSVFRTRLNRNEILELRLRVLRIANRREDNIRWYPICEQCLGNVIQEGAGATFEDDSFYLV